MFVPLKNPYFRTSERGRGALTADCSRTFAGYYFYSEFNIHVLLKNIRAGRKCMEIKTMGV